MSYPPAPDPEKRPWSGLTDYRRDLLAIVGALSTSGDPTGIGVHRRIESVRGTAPESTTYANLDALVDRDLIIKTGSGRENRYRLTDDGYRTLADYRDWLDGRKRLADRARDGGGVDTDE